MCWKWLGFGRQTETVTPTAREKINRYKELLATLTKRSPDQVNSQNLKRWSCRESGCIPYSNQLHVALTTLHMPIKRIEVNSLFRIHIENLPEGAFHFFLVDQTIAGNEIIIDPTYKQFFYNLNAEPEIFVGTRIQLEALFLKYRAHFKPQNLL